MGADFFIASFEVVYAQTLSRNGLYLSLSRKEVAVTIRKIGNHPTDMELTLLLIKFADYDA